MLGLSLSEPVYGASKAYVGLEAGQEVTEPVNPVDPDQPEVPVDPADPENQGTGETGPLSLDFVSNIAFGRQAIGAQTTSYAAQNQFPYVQVTDTTGTASGWQLTAAITEFRETSGESILVGAELSLNEAQVKSSATNVSLAPEAKNQIVFTNQESQVIAQAKPGSGGGTWVVTWPGEATDNQQVRLKVLGNTAKPVAYAATIYWNLVSGPESR